MKLKILALLLAVFVSLPLVSVAQADCDLSFTIHNGFDVPIEIVKIKTAAMLQGAGIPVLNLVYNTQWTGSVQFPSGQSHTFRFTVFNACVPLVGFPNSWSIKVHRANGKKHTCKSVSKTDSRTLTKPDNCK